MSREVKMTLSWFESSLVREDKIKMSWLFRSDDVDQETDRDTERDTGDGVEEEDGEEDDGEEDDGEEDDGEKDDGEVKTNLGEMW
jgi:hypothetical protein